nr:DUF3422 family protein [uncultured Hyphomonas sp.]
MSSWKDLSDRRPTYLMDTPCLTRNYVIRFGQPFDITASPSQAVGENRQVDLLTRLNDYIGLLNRETAPFAGQREIEQFLIGDPPPDPPEDQPESSARTIRRNRHETAFGVRLFAGVPVEVFIDLHSEYFTVQFRAYPCSARPRSGDGAALSPFVQSTAEVLKLLSTAHPDQSPWAAFETPEGWNQKSGIETHPLFEALCEVSKGKDNDFLKPEKGQEQLNALQNDKVSEAVTRLIYDDFWYYVLDCPKENLDIPGLSPKRRFEKQKKNQPPRPQGTFASILSYLRREDNSPNRPSPPAKDIDLFNLATLFKGLVIRPVPPSLEALLSQSPNSSGNGTPQLEKEICDAFGKQLNDLEFTCGDGGILDERQDKDLVLNRSADPAALEGETNTPLGVGDEFRRGVLYMNLFSPLLSRILGYRRGRSKFDDHMAGNTVLCGVLDGLAIYGSSFGRKTTWDANKDEVRYFIFFTGPSRNQLARLNRRINNAGEARVFSILELNRVRQAGDDLRRLDAMLDRLRREDSVTFKALSRLWSIHARIERKVRGGLRHRIGRTAYYRRRLKQRITDLRIRRLAGWQTYDEYIQRIFDPIHDTYERIGIRMADVEGKLANADEAQETRSANNLGRVGAIFAGLTAFSLIAEALTIDIKTKTVSQIDWFETARVWILLLPATLALSLLSWYLIQWLRYKFRDHEFELLSETEDEDLSDSF